MLGLRVYRFASKIQEKHGRAFDELKATGFLADWKLEKTIDKKKYKVIFYPGPVYGGVQQPSISPPKSTRIRERVEIAKSVEKLRTISEVDEELLRELLSRKIPEKTARELLTNLGSEQLVLDQLEYADQQIQQQGTIKNPPGFYISLVKENFQLPETYETRARRQERIAQAEAERRRLERVPGESCC